MNWKDTVLDDLAISAVKGSFDDFDTFRDVAKAQAEVSFKAGIKEVADLISNLIIGIDGCAFEERLDGDKGCIVLDMNENQWRARLKEWGLDAETIEDGFGNAWSAYCPECGEKTVSIVRPGKVQCSKCG